MLRVGLNQNQTNYQNKQQKPAFGASKNKVGRQVAKALNESDGTHVGINAKLLELIYKKTVLKEMSHGDISGAYDTAMHLNAIGEKTQKKGNLKLGNVLISYSGRIKGIINHVLNLIEIDLKDKLPVQKGMLKGYNSFMKRPIPKSMEEKII